MAQKMKCPKCGGTKLAIEKTPDGNSYCGDVACRYYGPTKNFLTSEAVPLIYHEIAIKDKLKSEAFTRYRNEAKEYGHKEAVEFGFDLAWSACADFYLKATHER